MDLVTALPQPMVVSPFRSLSNLAASIIQQFPALGLVPDPSHYVSQVPQLFPDKGPVPATFSGGHFLGQLSQGIQNPYTGSLPFGSQFPGQFPGGQLHAPPVRPVGSALASIATNDDLKCVPRIMCEIAAGGRPGHSSSSKQQQPALPFLTSDTLLS
jgi:hypothetical protein